jgi:hypothetical protein
MGAPSTIPSQAIPFHFSEERQIVAREWTGCDARAHAARRFNAHQIKIFA